MAIQYIFCINAGRSGSDYLTEIFTQAENTVSIHEGLPVMNGQPMIDFNNGQTSELSGLMPLKIAQIENKRKNAQKVYCETNHTFIKGWGYLLPDFYIPQNEIGVIVLRRDPEKVIRSFMRVRGIPGISEWSRTWYLSPDAKNNLSTPKETANYYDLCNWQIGEINLRAADYKKQFPNITYFECDLMQLNDLDFVLQMLDAFGLTATPMLKDVVGKPINTKAEWPQTGMDDLLATSLYPSADNLPKQEQDILIQEMTGYLLQEKKTHIVRNKSKRLDIRNSQLHFAREIVAHHENELEHEFQVQIRYTEIEILLIYEFLHTISPKDIAFFHILRTTEPHLDFRFDFNNVLKLSSIYHRLGFSTALKLLFLMLPGIRHHDFSHKTNPTAAH